MVKPKRVGHVVLNVSNVEESTKFYTEVLGFEVSSKRDIGTFLTCGRIHHDLALFQAPEDAAPVSRGQIGLNHVAVQVPDFDVLKETYRRLNECNVPIEGLTDHGMTSSIYFTDPDGIRIEYFCNTPETAEEGLAIMRSPERTNKPLVLEEAAV